MTAHRAFAAFAARKTAEALSARFEPFLTDDDRSAAFHLEPLGNDFTRAHLDGAFFQTPASHPSLPAMNLVFVQSREGNTEAEDPSALGGGDTDKHVIYEGLSRVSADAVLAGARTIGDGNLIFSVWHPALVSLRASLGKARHPAQIVATLAGALPIEDGLLFNVPELSVLILSAGQPAANLVERVRSRPWISVISSGETANLRVQAERLRRDLGIERISAVGGRTVATALLDTGLVTDLYLTTSPNAGGTPGTPLYAGDSPPPRELVVRKRSAAGAVFEHFILTS